METNKNNITKIIAAGKSMSIIGYTMIAGNAVLLILFIYLVNVDRRDQQEYETVVTILPGLLIALYLLVNMIIIGNLLRTGKNLKSCFEEGINDSTTNKPVELLMKLNVDGSHTGEFVEGGIIVYSDEKGAHGLVCSDSDLGNDNWNGAKRQCAEYKAGGFLDWRLPNKDELLLIYTMLHKNKGVGGFASLYYWSSTEEDKDSAWYHGFVSGSQENFSKDATFNFRAVRAF